MFLPEAHRAGLLPPTDHFESTRTMHQSPTGVLAQRAAPGGGLTHIQTVGAANGGQINLPNIFQERYQGREIRIQLTDVKKRREDSMDQNNNLQFEPHTGQPCADNSLSPLRRELKNSSISPIKNIFVETGQSLSRGTNPSAQQ